MLQKRFLMIPVAALALGFASPAFADCAADMEQVDAAVETANLADADRAMVDAAKAAADEKLQAGDEEGCQAELMPAKAILQIN
ncbi:MAG: hypothetical protein K8F25_17170 [Fimbriimonadaceae bacterium]|nr:hypothetical protein [Alphaproteobacteria bacterium]